MLNSKEKIFATLDFFSSFFLKFHLEGLSVKFSFCIGYNIALGV